MTPGPHAEISSLSKVRPHGCGLGVVRVPRFPVWQAWLGLLMFDVLGLGSNFERMHRCVKQWRTSQRSVPEDMVARVCTAINYACAWYPKRVLCLQRSAVTTCLLRSCGIPASLVMGAQILPFRAHAWTEVDGVVINEQRPLRMSYAILERC